MQKVIAWIDKEEWGKISALLSLGLGSIESPLERLVSRISTDIDGFPENIKPIITALRSWVGYSPEEGNETDE